MSNPTRTQAAKEIRAIADTIIDQRARWLAGWDKGRWNDHMRIVDRNEHNTIEASMDHLQTLLDYNMQFVR